MPWRHVGVRGERAPGWSCPVRHALDEKPPGSHSRSASLHSRRCAAIVFAFARSCAPRARRGARSRRRAARVRAQAAGRCRVALLDLDVGRRNAELLGDDLRVGGLVPLPLALRAKRASPSRRVHADLGRVEHLEAQDIEILRRPGADDLGEAADADAHQLATFALLNLFCTKCLLVHYLHRLSAPPDSCRCRTPKPAPSGTGSAPAG